MPQHPIFFFVLCFLVDVMRLKTVCEQRGDVCTEDSEVSCPLQRKQHKENDSSPSGSSLSYQHLNYFIKTKQVNSSFQVHESEMNLLLLQPSGQN